MSVTACPGCDAGRVAAERSAAQVGTPTYELVLPGIHCLGCIKTVESVLTDQAGITAARVNLSRKRVSITATPGQDPAPWIAALARAGYEAHESRAVPDATADRGLLLRLGIAGFAMMNVMLLSVAVWSGATDATRDLFHWIAAMIALPAALFCAQPFFTSAWGAVQRGRLNMDVPISLAILLACGLSLYETLNSGEHAYFDAALSLTFFLLGGRYLESRMRSAARSAAADLAALEPRRVTVIQNGEHLSRPVEDVAKGDTIWLAAGGRVPVDATLQAEAVTVDRSALTGESDPLTLPKGAPLIAGDVVLTGPVTITATANSQGSTLRRMVELAQVAEAARSRYTSLAERAAGLYAPLVHGLSFAAGLGWYVAIGDAHFALTVAISTLIITCPCALGLAVPAVATVATGRLYRAGILVKSDTALERLAEVDTVVFDKTGTLTEAALTMPADLPAPARGVLKALAEASDHPLSRSLLPALDQVAATPLADIAEHRGKGIAARWGDRDVWLGAGPGGTVLRLGDQTYLLARTERVLPGAAETVAALQAKGLEVHLLTGDQQVHAQRIAADLGLKRAEAQMTPDTKLNFINVLQAQGRKVLMIGDGLNDTLALTAAWASIAPGKALEASQNAADVVLLTGDIPQVLTALGMARQAHRRILENFGLAALYNCIAIPLAVAGFATPLMAALAMSSSSITVTLNALRTRAT